MVELNFASCVVHQTRSYNTVWFLWLRCKYECSVLHKYLLDRGLTYSTQAQPPHESMKPMKPQFFVLRSIILFFSTSTKPRQNRPQRVMCSGVITSYQFNIIQVVYRASAARCTPSCRCGSCTHIRTYKHLTSHIYSTTYSIHAYTQFTGMCYPLEGEDFNHVLSTAAAAAVESAYYYPPGETRCVGTIILCAYRNDYGTRQWWHWSLLDAASIAAPRPEMGGADDFLDRSSMWKLIRMYQIFYIGCNNRTYVYIGEDSTTRMILWQLVLWYNYPL